MKIRLSRVSLALIGLLMVSYAGCSGGSTAPPFSPESTPIDGNAEKLERGQSTFTAASTPRSAPTSVTLDSPSSDPSSTASLTSEDPLGTTATPTPIQPPEATPTVAAPTTSRPTDSPTLTPVPSPTPTATVPIHSPIGEQVQTGLLATVPGYATIDITEATELIKMVYPSRVPQSIQILLLLTQDDQAYVVIAVDTTVDRFFTAGTVTGIGIPVPDFLPTELDFVGSVIVTDDISLMEPIVATPDQVNSDPVKYAFKRVVMDTTYTFASARIKDAPPSLDHIGFGLASDKFGSNAVQDYLTIIDPYNTETQIRVAELTGTVLYPTEAIRRLLEDVYRFTSEDVRQALDRPSVFYEELADDDAQLVEIEDLVPTVNDPSLKLHQFHGEMISVQGIALGVMVRTEDIPKLQDLPIQLTFKTIGVVDLTGAMPIVGISSEDVSGEVFGFFRFDLSVYTFDDGQTFAFLIDKESVPLDPIAEVGRAEFGQRIKTTLSNYLVSNSDAIQVIPGLVLQQIDLMIPSSPSNPIVVIRHDDLSSGDYLSEIGFDGYLVDGRILGLPEDLMLEYGPGVVLVDAQDLEFQKGVFPVPTPLVESPPGGVLP